MKISFTILGNLVSGKNNRQFVYVKGKPRFIVSKDATAYKKTFDNQCPQIPQPMSRNIILYARIYYRSNRSDLCDTLLSDLLQSSGIITNDRYIVEKHLYKFIDKQNPRVEITLLGD